MSEEHTTDRVLEVKIEGLSKLTDERFKNQDITLTRLEKKLDDIGDAGYITKTEYEERHKDLVDAYASLQKQVNFNSKMIWMATGVVGVIGFLSPIFFHFWFGF